MAKGWTGVMPGVLGEAYGCPEPHCYYYVRYKPGVEQHDCPRVGETSYGWSDTVGFVEDIWGFLDECIDKAKDTSLGEEERKIAGYQARAHCKTLVLFMSPIFSTEKEIAKEGVKRWEARQAGDTSYVTPGWLAAKLKTITDGKNVPYQMNEFTVKNVVNGVLDAAVENDRRFREENPDYQVQYPDAARPPLYSRGLAAIPPDPHRPYPTDPAAPTKRLVKPKHNLTDDQLSTLKQFASSGAKHSELARMFGISEETVASILLG